jgi:hypothetical protein
MGGNAAFNFSSFSFQLVLNPNRHGQQVNNIKDPITRSTMQVQVLGRGAGLMGD